MIRKLQSNAFVSRFMTSRKGHELREWTYHSSAKPGNLKPKALQCNAETCEDKSNSIATKEREVLKCILVLVSRVDFGKTKEWDWWAKEWEKKSEEMEKGKYLKGKGWQGRKNGSERACRGQVTYKFVARLIGNFESDPKYPQGAQTRTERDVTQPSWSDLFLALPSNLLLLPVASIK